MNDKGNETRHMHVFLHIGTHKTGTTAFQRFLRDNAPLLKAEHDLSVYSGQLSAANHVELHMAALRPELETIARIKFAGKSITEAGVRDRIASFLAEADTSRALFSNEALSYLRDPGEAQRLRELFPDGTTFTILLMLRDAESYLTSYTAELEKSGWSLSDDPASVFYTKPDSWLKDFDKMRAGFEAVFKDVRVLDYVPRETIPRLLGEMSITLQSEDILREANKTPHKYPIRRVLKRLGRLIRFRR